MVRLSRFQSCTGYTAGKLLSKGTSMHSAKYLSAFVLACTVLAGNAQDATKGKKTEKVVVEGKPETPAPLPEQADSSTDHSITVGGKAIAYTAVAGTITVGGTDQFDAMLGLDGKMLADTGMNPPDATKPEDAPATARMFYTAYFARGARPGTRPVMFLYNGGPGSATMWLHMGSFGPRRVVTPDTEHQTAAPYTMVDNQYSLLDTTDLVFIDAPGTGFSRIHGQGRGEGLLGHRPGRARV